MITVDVDLNELFDMGKNIEDADYTAILIDCANSTLGNIKQRVFIDGTDSNDGQIGTYSEAYMKVRTGNYPETRLKSGKNKGEFRKAKTKAGQAGVYSKGKNKGQPRPRYNRSTDTKVIGSLTREMENDMKVIADGDDVYIGFSNEHNWDKSQWLEETYKKDIWLLTESEDAQVDELVNDFIDEIIG